MKFGTEEADLDATDMHILAILQENCKLPLAKVGEQVGLSAPAVETGLALLAAGDESVSTPDGGVRMRRPLTLERWT